MPAAANPHAPWKLPIIVPLWILQILLPAVYLFGLPIVASSNRSPYGNNKLGARTFVIMFFSFVAIFVNVAEIVLFVNRKLDTRTYLLCQWAKATLAGIVWFMIELLSYTLWRWELTGFYSMSNFVFQHPALLASLYYGSRAYSKYGGDAGRQVPGQGEAADESSPLLTEDTENV